MSWRCAVATLADVARLAGVSQATASRIVNGSDKLVTDELRTRVLRAVAQLQYVPNAHAQQLARADRTAVGVIVHDVSDPYFAEITRGLQRVATAHGRLVMICNSYGDPDAAFTRSLNLKLDAYVRAGGRVTVIGRHELFGDSVMPENEIGGYLIGAEVFGLGHRKVGVIAGPAVLTTTTDRLAGLRRAAREHHRSLGARRVAYANFDRDSGAAAAARLLDANPDLTAIIALNDSMAIGALAMLRSRGRSVPEDVTVVGFDDMPIARDVTPALTTVRLPLVDMGERAMTIALSAPGDGPRVERMAAEVVRRASSGPPRIARS